jgi:hypothetical protein
MTKRNLVTGAGLVLVGSLVLLVLLALSMWQQARIEQRVADTRLQTAQKIQALVEGQLQTDLDTRGEMIAGDQAFIGYINQAKGGTLPGTPVDTASIVDLLEERREQLGLAIVAVVDRQGQLIASRDHLSNRHSLGHDPMLAKGATDDAAAHDLWVEDGKIFLVSLLPLTTYGSDAGFLLVGLPLDEALAERLGNTFDGEAALYAKTGQGFQLASSSNIYVLEEEIPADVRKELTRDAHQFDVHLRGGTYRGYVAPLFGSDVGRTVLLVKTDDTVSTAVKQGLPLILGAGLALLGGWIAAMRWRSSRPPMATRAASIARGAATGDEGQ